MVLKPMGELLWEVYKGRKCLKTSGNTGTKLLPKKKEFTHMGDWFFLTFSRGAPQKLKKTLG